ncbi:MAG: methionyl-tRNA formyltransferase [Acidobacteria bacterium]|nr:methionyl-tRNA formyltransferase [Acidobacteriota bacterium]
MKIVFMGTPLAAVPSLQNLLRSQHEVVAVWTQPDRPAGRGNKLTAPAVKEFAVENKLNVFQPLKIKNQEALELFASHKADVAIVVAYGRILPPSFLEAFPKGAINVHFSLLPKYRGAAPVNWAIVNGETKTGVTTMRMDAGLDTGDILLQTETLINTEENAIDLMARLSFEGANLLIETLESLETITPRGQYEADASYAPMLFKEEGHIDWSSKAETIVNHIRGFQPFPTSYSFFQDKKITIFSACVYQLSVSSDRLTDDFLIENGTILEAKGDDLIVTCGENTALRLLEIQVEGRKRMKARDFLNGVQIQIGEKLG